MGAPSFGQPHSAHGTLQRTFVPGDVAFGFPALATGASYTATPGNFDWWRLIAVRFSATTDGNAANRTYSVQYVRGTALVVAEDGASVLVTANTSGQVFDGSYLRGVAEWNTGTAVWFPLSGLWIPNGWGIKINIGSVQAGDTLANVAFTFDVAQVRGDGTAEADAAADAARYG